MVTSGGRPWTTPELVVLVRNRPEEAVLAGCKNSTRAGPSADFSGCKVKQNKNMCKDPCSINTTS